MPDMRCLPTSVYCCPSRGHISKTKQKRLSTEKSFIFSSLADNFVEHAYMWHTYAFVMTGLCFMYVFERQLMCVCVDYWSLFLCMYVILRLSKFSIKHYLLTYLLTFYWTYSFRFKPPKSLHGRQVQENEFFFRKNPRKNLPVFLPDTFPRTQAIVSCSVCCIQFTRANSTLRQGKGTLAGARVTYGWSLPWNTLTPNKVNPIP